MYLVFGALWYSGLSFDAIFVVRLTSGRGLRHDFSPLYNIPMADNSDTTFSLETKTRARRAERGGGRGIQRSVRLQHASRVSRMCDYNLNRTCSICRWMEQTTMSCKEYTKYLNRTRYIQYLVPGMYPLAKHASFLYFDSILFHTRPQMSDSQSSTCCSCTFIVVSPVAPLYTLSLLSVSVLYYLDISSLLPSRFFSVVCNCNIIAFQMFLYVPINER